MKALFYWPDSKLNPQSNAWDHAPRDVFWVSMTEEEAASYGLTVDEGNRDVLSKKGLVYVFAPANPLLPGDGYALMRWVYPHSGMWNGRRPWIAIGDTPDYSKSWDPEGYEIFSLDELEDLKFKIKNLGWITLPEKDAP